MTSPLAAGHEIPDALPASRYYDEAENESTELAELLSHDRQDLEDDLRRPSKTSAPYRFRVWLQGPQPPVVSSITPLLPELQNLSADYLECKVPGLKLRLSLLFALCMCWIAAFGGYLSHSEATCRFSGYKPPVRFSCTSRFWPGATQCGIDGHDCRPFHNLTLAFRCPADCRDTKNYSPETIGPKEYNYRNLVIGGKLESTETGSRAIYRGDSFICPAALHAGVVSDQSGGGGVVNLVGEHRDFGSVESHGITSLNFTPAFPLAFEFPQGSRDPASGCDDPRWRLLILTILTTTIVSLFVRSSPAFFWPVFAITYFCVALATDPVDYRQFVDVVSTAFRGFLPASFVGVIVHRYSVAKTMQGLNAPLERALLWLGGLWLGALNNLTFDKLPLQRLTPHDLRQPGAIITLVSLTTVIALITLLQARSFWQEGRLPHYLAFYACVGASFAALALVPNMVVRVHHFILALLLLPGTALQTRPSLLFQGLLVGLFISGIARWGFDSVLQTSVDLFGSDFGSPIPEIARPQVSENQSQITFSLRNVSSGFDSMSVVVDDVERFRGAEDHNERSFTWDRPQGDGPTYFRFAYVKYGIASKSLVGKFSNPGIWNLDGEWIAPEPKDPG